MRYGSGGGTKAGQVKHNRKAGRRGRDSYAKPSGRHCAICGRAGGAGMERALTLLRAEAERLGEPLNWHSTDTYDGKAHGPCVIREKKRLGLQSC